MSIAYSNSAPAKAPSALVIQLRSSECHSTFRHAFDIYLKDSNAYTNTYFARYFEWQGVCRERWFHQCISEDMLQSQGVFITKRAHTEYLHETFPFQTVECELNSFDVRHCSFYLLFRFKVAGQLVASGYQQIVFASLSKQIQRLPADVLAKIRGYEVNESGGLVSA